MTDWGWERGWPLAAGGLAALALLLAARIPREAPVPRRDGAALALRLAAVLLAAAAATGPHALLPSHRPRHLVIALPAAEAGSPLPSLPGGETSILVRGIAPADRVAAAAAALDPGADSRVLLMVDPGEEGEEARAGVAALTARGVPVLVGRNPLPEPGTGSDGAPLPALLLGATTRGAPSPSVPVAVALRWAPAAETEGARADLFVAGVGAAVADAGSREEAAVRLGAGRHVIEVRARDRLGRPRGRALLPVHVPGEPRVLLLQEGPEPSALAEALAAQGIPVERRGPADTGDLARFSVVVVGPGARGDGALEEAVRWGLGLLATGGPRDGNGAGRFRGSPLAAALPVFLPPPVPDPPPPPAAVPPPPPDAPPAPGPETRLDDGERPGSVVTLLLVVDASGSMAGTKMEMARRAAFAAAETLAPVDRFGLLAFTDEPRWAVAPGPAGDGERILRSLRELSAEGGTDLLPALKEARRALRREETAVRHVIVLSDGVTPPFGLHDIVDGMVEEGVTLSTVGIGADYDARLLGSLAVRGRGRTYAALDPSALPRIVTMDAVRFAGEAGAAARKAPDLPDPPQRPADPPPPDPSPDPAVPRGQEKERDGDATPLPVEAADPVAALEGLGPWPPALPPEAAPDARPATAVALRFAGGGPPLLVLGRHGLGRTAFFAAAADGGDPPRTPGPWPTWERYGAFAARLVRALASPPAGSPAEVVSVVAGFEGTAVVLEVGGEGALPAPRVELLHARGDSPAGLDVVRVGDRRFRVPLPPADPGPRLLLLSPAGATAPIPVAVADPGPPPDGPLHADPLARLLDGTGAAPLRGGVPPAAPPRPGPPLRRPLAGALLAAAVAAFVADAALRRWGRR